MSTDILHGLGDEIEVKDDAKFNSLYFKCTEGLPSATHRVAHG